MSIKLFKFTNTRFVFLAIVLILIALLVLNTNYEEQQKIDFKIAIGNTVRTLDPTRVTDALSFRIGELIYYNIIEFDNNFNPYSRLLDFEVISATQYKFSLKENMENIKFDILNRNLTLVDIVATIKAIIADNSTSPFKFSLNHISNISIVENQMLITLSKPDLLFLSKLSIAVMPNELIGKHDFNKEPISYGDFIFKSKEQNGIKLLRRKDYKTFYFEVVKDDNIRLLKLLNGEIDFFQNNLSPELLKHAQKQKNIKTKVSKGNSFQYIGFNLNDSYLKDIRVRLAIAHAIDRQAIILNLYAGNVELASTLLNPSHWVNQGLSDLYVYTYSPEKAKKLLAEWAFENKVNLPFELSFKSSNNSNSIRLASIYQSYLKKIGINLKIQTYDWGTFYADIISGKFQLYSLAWVGIKSPDIFKYVFHSKMIPPKGANRGRYVNKKIDKLLNQAEIELQLQQQILAYQEIQKIVNRDLVYLPLWYMNNYYLHGKNISGFSTTTNGSFKGLNSIKKHKVKINN